MLFSLLLRALRRIRREGWVIFITLLALATRLYWNLVIHPPRKFIFSDMGGYFNRAEDFVRQPLTATADYLAFYPWGAHAFFGLVRLLFTTPTTCPRDAPNGVAADGCWPMDASLAVLGAIGVCYTMLLARRLTRCGPGGDRRRWLYVIVGLALTFYYPLISQGSFFMSEIPLFACLSAATFHSVRLADEGKTSDAVLFSVFAGLGTLARPQMLMSVVFLGVFWLFRRRQLGRVTLKKLAIAGVPLALILAFSAVRTTLHLRTFQGHEHEYALVSTNDALNYAFGRCHPVAIEAHMKGYGSFFGPPSLGSLHFSVKEKKKKYADLEATIADVSRKLGKAKNDAERTALRKRLEEAQRDRRWLGLQLELGLELKPAMAPDLTCDVNKRHQDRKEDVEPCINTTGKMWSREVMNDLARKCVKTTGVGRQLYYALTHVALNYGFNRTWPDSGQPRRDTWVDLRLSHLGKTYDKEKDAPPQHIKLSSGGVIIEPWQIGFGATIVPFATVACFLAFRRRRARDGLLAMHIFALNFVGILYFGDTRLRTPYDGLLLILALDLLSRALRWVGRRGAHLLLRRPFG